MKMLDRGAGDPIELASFWGEQKSGALRLFLVDGRPAHRVEDPLCEMRTAVT
jgi:hypothetical protein